MPEKKKIYLVDSHALLYRAYWAFIRRPLVTTSGENTSAIFGFMRMILRLMKDEKPEYMVCVFDSKKKTFRHEIYEKYKATRLKPPEDLNKQIEFTKKLLEEIGLPVMIKEGYEADDVMGTIAEKISSMGDEAIIVSGDKDILQLVDGNIRVYAVKKGISEMEIMDGEKIKRVWGVSPENVIDVLALMGDQADNIPGVKGIGEKTALQLISRFGSLEELYANLDKVDSESIRKKLIEGKDNAFLSKKLVIIKRDVPVEFDVDMFRIKDFPRESGIEMLKEKELNTIVAELKPELIEKESELKAETPPSGRYSLVTSTDGLEKIREVILKAPLLSIDTETTGKDPMDSELVGISLCVKEGEGYYIPIKGKGVANGGELLDSIKPVLENREIKKIGQNIKYDILVLKNNGIELNGIEGDTFIAAYLLDPQKQRYKLDELAKEFLNYKMVSYGDVVKNKGETLLDYDLEEVANYSCEDADIALRLYKIMKEKLVKEGLYDLYRDIEVPLINVLARMEYWGVKIDTAYLEEMSRKFDEELSRLEGEIYELVGEEFNVRSTKQLAEILFDKLKIPPVKKTKTGFSTDESVLEELAGKYEVAKLLLRHRRLSKLKSTYIDSLPKMVNKRTGRIHTSFNQTITTTGRLSSSNPNLQNIPIREEEGRAIRRAFIAEDGWYILSADYSQIELRILASLSGDPSLMSAFLRDGDVHRETASILFGVEPEKVTEEQRAAAKTINFSVIYGMSPYGLAQRLNISKSEAAFFIDMYFQKYSGVRNFFDQLVEKVKKNGYVETLLGRRRYVPEINSENKNIFEAAKRVAINTPIQGTAADLIKKAMVCIDNEIIKRGLRTKMLIQVHDELVFEVPEEELEQTSNMVKDLMENAIKFNVPLKVNIAYGKNWEEAH